ncbi:cadherin repeat domain-containing protein [Pontixanthobacter aestiaquae]|uniref:Cadherin domain-containing protein n=1 Tax=Pontixanthobacter aestiaquae TaxID=1509367 RepID=A0A844Z7Q6_9SPHN|nr:cadherin repeat domain-containing protein [Pontixanthobacter aestiaquae]MDN3647085.1 cadherin repeat domain-containing protein [Pontixanthobacter aestiaquae]MXO81939.1 hypothetical protein [Pontixanthobacter aestiaquae]
MLKKTLIPCRVAPIPAALAALLLGSCGGGGGEGGAPSTPSPSPVVTAPRFTSVGAASVAENTADTFYTATATDPQGDPISFAVISGPDADKFVIDGSGALRFNTPPNFDLPTDSDLNNIYVVGLRATAGGETANLSLSVTITNDREGIAVRRIATGFVDPVDFSFVHDTPELLVAERSGRVLRFDPSDGSVTEDTFIRDNKISGEILAIAYAFPGRQFQEGTYIVTHSDQAGLYLQGFNGENGRKGFSRLGDPSAQPGSASLIAQNELYGAIGNPGGDAAQNTSSAYGKLLRAGIFNVFGGASIPPPGRLIVGAQIIGDGIQNPSGFTPAADFLYLADQGSTVEHELTIFRRDWRPLDFGWPFYEGTQASSTNPPAMINGPTLAYDFGQANKQGTGIVAGLLNNANFFEALGSTYVFADTNGIIWSIPYSTLIDGFLHRANEFEVRTEDFEPDVGSIDSPVAFARGSAGDHFYILDSDGEIFRVEPAS